MHPGFVEMFGPVVAEKARGMDTKARGTHTKARGAHTNFSGTDIAK